jgi:hypothetical protein
MSREIDADHWWAECIGHITLMMWLHVRTPTKRKAIMIKSINPSSNIVFGKDDKNKGEVK